MNNTISIPTFRLPALVARVGGKLPQWPHTLALVAGLNAAVKMKLLPVESLSVLEGRSFLVEVRDTGGKAQFTYRAGLFRPLFSAVPTPDLSFRASLSAFMQLLARQEDPDTLFFKRELCVEGDTELGLFVKNMLDAVEWPQLPKAFKLSR
ncbi:SCP2 domain-containing protein [Ferrigenium sp. UT5]|uniref:ubiquinone anaerobic biosynthesis accessory factor UbiT n=1 Tax=Ferrigenium sp. UT5 TaxID=3242105 RepID=UPI00354E8651